MNDITVKFVDFWKGFDQHDNFLLRILQGKYNVTVLDSDSDDTPEFLFCSTFGHRYLDHHGCIRIYFTGENDVPDFNMYDYGISFHDIDFAGRHLRFPLYVVYDEFRTIYSGATCIDMSDDALLNRDFCSVVISNIHSSDPIRETIWNKINSYRPVASGGRYRNNIGKPVPEKVEFICNYKFNLAIENSMVDGYTTEKIVEPFAALTVPIYWGNRKVSKEFNPEAFINISDFSTIDRAIDFIRTIDNNDSAYLKMLHSSKLTSYSDIDWDERLASFLCGIIDNRHRHVSDYGFQQIITTDQRIKEFLYDRKLLRGISRRLLTRTDS